jgi:hypothetical protein
VNEQECHSNLFVVTNTMLNSQLGNLKGTLLGKRNREQLGVARLATSRCMKSVLSRHGCCCDCVSASRPSRVLLSLSLLVVQSPDASTVTGQRITSTCKPCTITFNQAHNQARHPSPGSRPAGPSHILPKPGSATGPAPCGAGAQRDFSTFPTISDF